MSDALIPAADRYEREAALLSEGARASLQAQLWEVLATQAERYTMGESSSLPEETVGELLRSVCFCIGLRLKAGQTLSTPLAILLEEGQRQAWALAQRGRSMLEVVQREALPVDNLSYQDTLRALPEFFRLYDYRFFAHQVPCMIDYQLCVPVPAELEGVEYILTYLRRLHTENRVCGRVPPAVLLRLLRAMTPDYEGLLINLMDGVFPNAVGCVLLGKDPRAPFLDDSDRAALVDRFHPWNESAAQADMGGAVHRLCAAYQLEGEEEYLQLAGQELLGRIHITDPEHYSGIFLDAGPDTRS